MIAIVKAPKEEQAIKKAICDCLHQTQWRAKTGLIDPEMAAREVIEYLDYECVVLILGKATQAQRKRAAETTTLVVAILENDVWVTSYRTVVPLSKTKDRYVEIDNNISYWLRMISPQAVNEWARNKLKKWGLCAPTPNVVIENAWLITGAKAAIAKSVAKKRFVCTKYGCWSITGNPLTNDLHTTAKHLARSLNVSKSTAVNMLLGHLSPEEIEMEITFGRLAKSTTLD